MNHTRHSDRAGRSTRSGRLAVVAVAAVLGLTTIVAASALLAVYTNSASANPAATHRIKPNPTRTPTPTPTPTPAPSPTPTTETCSTSVTWSDSTYCTVPSITFLTDGTEPPGTLLAASAYVGYVDGQTVSLTEFASCPPGDYCGSTFVDAVVTFAPDAGLPRYGELIAVYGITTPGGFAVNGYALLVPCEYALGCA